MRFGITGANTRAWFEILPLGCRESAVSNLARNNAFVIRPARLGERRELAR